jgi:hypothetical protein
VTRSDLLDITVDLKMETGKAWLVFDGTTEAWIPKSQAELEKHPSRRVWTLTAPEWLLVDKGLL